MTAITCSSQVYGALAELRHVHGSDRGAILRPAVNLSAQRRVDGEVRLARCCLLAHARSTTLSNSTRNAAQQKKEIGRAQGVTAAFNGIVRQLRFAGRYDKTSP
ncbi:hypothetical protein [Novosphingobium sp. ZW T3_23]|uniref:hypothetical protein n=1 Tax=Novosphingobium sp. ZW T3_23 TaxID=3378084 RepID=UPI003852983C